MSREALRLFIEESLPYSEKCYPGIRPLYDGFEDLEFGNCMHSVGVLAKGLVDEEGRLQCLESNPVAFIVKDDPPDSSRRKVLLVVAV